MNRSPLLGESDSRCCMGTPTALPFSSEFLAHILSYFDDARDVVAASLVSTQWNATCIEYQEMIWKSVCANCLNNLEKFPFMKSVTGEKFNVQAYEGLYSSWKEIFVNLFYGQLKRFTSEYQMYVNTIFNGAQKKDDILKTIKKKCTLVIPYTFPHQDGNEGMEDKEMEENDDEDNNREYEDNSPIGSSKIGGLPDLPKGIKWPVNAFESKRLLKFVCQINLSDLKNYHSIKGIMPTCGWLFCFIDCENLEEDDYKDNPLSFYWKGPIEILERYTPEEVFQYEKPMPSPFYLRMGLCDHSLRQIHSNSVSTNVEIALYKTSMHIILFDFCLFYTIEWYFCKFS